MAEDDDKDSKTEEPTEKKISKAREEGDVPSSQEVKSLGMLIAALAVVSVISPWAAAALSDEMSGILIHSSELRLHSDTMGDFLAGMVVRVGSILAVPMALLFLVALGVGLSENGLMFTPKKVQPKLSNISPISGFKKVVSTDKLMDFFKSILKIVVVTGAVALILGPTLAHPDVYVGQSFWVTLDDIHWLLVLVSGAVLVGFVAIAIGDYLWQRHKHREKLKMTKQELKDEYKQSEGDPMVKGKIRELRMRRSRERMMAAVPEASVVITNPTHFAVALKYDMDAMAAPVLIAKGADFIAKKIREVATEHDVPIVENRPLARALYASVELDQEVPPEHYKAVAEVIGYVMKLKKAAGPAAQRREGATR